MTTLPALLDKDPTELGFPPMLPMELAAGTGTVAEVCESYGIDRDRYRELRVNPLFMAAHAEAVKMIGEAGSSFKMKLRTMAELFLKRAYDLVNEPGAPPAVQADLIKFAVNAAGLNASIEQKASASGKATAAAVATINIHLR